MNVKKRKTLFITGGTGFVGPNLVRGLLYKGYTIYLLVREKKSTTPIKRVHFSLDGLIPGNRRNLYSNIHYVIGDITYDNLGISDEQTRGLKGKIDEIWHCSALVVFNEHMREELHNINLSGTERIIEFANKINCKNINYVGTAFVAGNYAGQFKESDLSLNQGFNNPYEESKFKTELFLKEIIAKGKMNITIFRPSIVVDYDRKRAMTSTIGYYGMLKALLILKNYCINLIKVNNTKAKESGIEMDCKGNVTIPMTIPGISNGILNFVSTDFVIETMLAVEQDQENYNKVYHLTNPIDINMRDLSKFTTQGLNINNTTIGERDINSKLTRIEKFFFNKTKVYLPYFTFKATFDRYNTEKILSKYSVADCPPFDRKAIDKICRDFTQSLDYGSVESND